MMSLRALSRALPRSAPRIANYTTRTARPALQTISRQRIAQQTPRYFSLSATRFDDASQELAAKLNQEIQLESEESSNPADSNGNISAFLAQNPHWEIIDNEGEHEVLLKRKYEDEDVTVAFSIAEFNAPYSEGEEADEALMDEDDDMESAQSGGANTKGAVNQGRTSGGNVKVAPEDRVAPGDREELRDAEDDQEGQAFPAYVNVLVQRKSKGALRISLMAENGVFSVQSVTPLADNKKTSSATAAELLRDEPQTLYTGPPFLQLDEEVQSLIEQYLDVRGINTALALFVPEYMDVKEQKEYLGWLGRVKAFVE